MKTKFGDQHCKVAFSEEVPNSLRCSDDFGALANNSRRKDFLICHMSKLRRTLYGYRLLEGATRVSPAESNASMGFGGRSAPGLKVLAANNCGSARRPRETIYRHNDANIGIRIASSGVAGFSRKTKKRQHLLAVLPTCE